MRMTLKKWMLRVVKDLEAIVSKHPERICLGNQTNLLKNKVIAEQFWTQQTLDARPFVSS